MTTTAWDSGRLDDIDRLRQLLREVLTINSGSGCLTRLALCIELAEELDKNCLRTGRQSFVRFLEERIEADRAARAAPLNEWGVTPHPPEWMEFVAWAQRQWGKEAWRHTINTCGEWDAWQASADRAARAAPPDPETTFDHMQAEEAPRRD